MGDNEIRGLGYRHRQVGSFGIRTMASAVVASSLLGSGGFVAAEPSLLKPERGPWDGGSGFSLLDKKTRRSVSGIACPPNASGQRLCLVVFDEGVEARYVVIHDNSYSMDDEAVVLRKSDGELDAEGAATDGRFFYVTGSHSVKRSGSLRWDVRRRTARLQGHALNDRFHANKGNCLS